MAYILITGGAGSIGGSLARELLKNEKNFVVIADNLITGQENNLPKINQNKWKFINSNINIYSDISAIMKTYKFDYVFHYAALVGVERTQKYPLKVLFYLAKHPC